MIAYLMEIPNAVALPDGTLMFVERADEVAESLGLKPASAMPPAYERHALRRIFWNEYGLHYDDLPRGEVDEALLFRELERQHPQRFRRGGRDGKSN